MQISAREYSSASEMLSEYAARQRRTWPVKRVNVYSRPLPSAPIIAPEPPLWQCDRIKFEHHVLAYRAETSAIDYMRHYKLEIGLIYAENPASKSSVEATLLKNAATYALKTKFKLSHERIATLMKVEQSTVGRRVNMHCIANGLTVETAHTTFVGEMVELAKAQFQAGVSIPKIAKQMRVSQNTIIARARADGWYVSVADRAYEKFVAAVDRKYFEALILVGFSMRSLKRKTGGSEPCIMRLCDEMGLVFNERG
jgi:hypothetical protein